MKRQSFEFLKTKGIFVAGIMSLLVFVSACGGGSEPDPSEPPAQAGTVRGAAVDGQNRPLSGAKIDICSSVFANSCISGTTGADGRYSLTLTSNNVWGADASITRSYDGKTFCLPLAVDNPDSFSSTDGATRNFTWKLSGLVPGRNPNGYASAYFGATLNVVLSVSTFLDQHRVRVNLAPNGPLIDGSAGSAFSAIVGDWGGNAIGNIPVGVYTVTAEYVQPGGAPVPLRITTNLTQPYAASAVVHFAPDSVSCLIEPEATVYVEP